MEDDNQADVEDGEDDPVDQVNPMNFPGQDGCDEKQDRDDDEDSVAVSDVNAKKHIVLSSYSMDFQTSNYQIDGPCEEGYHHSDEEGHRV